MHKAYKSPSKNPKEKFRAPGASVLSPAIPIEGTPIAQMRSYFYSTHGKVEGLTPDGSIQPLSKYTGRAHRFLKQPNGVSVSEHTSSRNPETDYTQLLVLLKNLKERSDVDYRVKKITGSVDPRHLHYAQELLGRCIPLLKKCYRNASDKADFLNTLNDEINKNVIYNPFGLRKIYNTNQFDMSLAQDPNCYAEALTASDFPRVARAPVSLLGLLAVKPGKNRVALNLLLESIPEEVTAEESGDSNEYSHVLT